MNHNNDYSNAAAAKVAHFDCARALYKSYFMAQIKAGLYEDDELIRIFNEIGSINDKSRVTHWLISINFSKTDEEFEGNLPMDMMYRHQEIVKFITRTKWVRDYFYLVYELGGKNGGEHCHMLIRNNQNRKGRTARQIHVALQDFVASDACVDIKGIPLKDVDRTKDYLRKADYPEERARNQKFCDMWKLDYMYTHEEFSWGV